MWIIVTGANGFVGSKVCEHFKSKGKDVIGVDISKGKHVDYVFDLAEKELKTVVEINYCDVVIHLAGKTSVSHSWVDKTVLFDNIRMAWNVAQCGCRIVNASSTEIYANSPYGISKKACEDILELFSSNVCNLRFGNVIGKGCQEGKVVTDFVKGAKIGVLKHGNISYLRYFVNISDLINLISIVAFRGGESCYNAFNCRNYVSDIIFFLAKEFSFIEEKDPSKCRTKDYDHECLGFTHTEWNPKHTLESSILEMI